MRYFLRVAVYAATVAAIWYAWGWGAAAIAAIVSLVVFGSAKSRWGLLRFINPMTWVRIAVEVTVLIAGLIAANIVWGTIWAAVLLAADIVRFIFR